MAAHDNIGDFLTIIRNSSNAGKLTSKTAWSKMREGIAQILKQEGYIRDYSIEDVKSDSIKTIVIENKFVDGQTVIKGLVRHSKPGRRAYYQYREVPKVLGGLGISILTTPKGILSDKQARKEKVGGELLCKVW